MAFSAGHRLRFDLDVFFGKRGAVRFVAFAAQAVYVDQQQSLKVSLMREMTVLTIFTDRIVNLLVLHLVAQPFMTRETKIGAGGQ